MTGSHVTAFITGLAFTAAAAVAVAAQQPTTSPAPTPEVGTIAPNFTLTGATRYGVLRDSIRLSDLRGQTVVLAFFIQARTKG